MVSTRILATITVGTLFATPSAAQLMAYLQLSATDGPGAAIAGLRLRRTRGTHRARRTARLAA